jgi:hypothetical protein
MLSCCTLAVGQTTVVGTLAGKLTDLRSEPLKGITVVARNESTGAEAQGITQRNGGFRFDHLAPGTYTVMAESAQLGQGQLQGVLVSAGHEARVQAAMAFLPKSGVASGFVVWKAADAREGKPLEQPASVALPVVIALPAVVALPVVTASPLAAAVLRLVPQTFSGINAMVAGTPANSARSPLAVSETTRLVPGTTFPTSSIAAPLVPGESLAALNLSALHLAMAPLPNVDLGAILSGEVARSTVIAGALGAQAAYRPAANPGRQAAVVAESADRATSAVATVMTGEQIQALPAAGRRWQDFLIDTPTASSASGGRESPQLRGDASAPVATTLDGAPTRMAFGGQGVSGPQSSGPGANGVGGSAQNGMGQAWAAGRGLPVAEAAIYEVQTVAGNTEAQALRAAGGQINVNTVQAGEQFHGQGFGFDKQNGWGAQNPFTQWVKQTSPATLTSTATFTPEAYTPSDRETIWGVGVGSRIKRESLFWFGALDSYSRNDPGLATVKHPDEFFAQPSNDQMQVLSARLALSPANPVAEGLNAYSGMLTALDGLLGPAARTARQWVAFGRLDWDPAERHRFTLEGTGARWNAPGGGLTRVSEPYGANSFGSSKASEQLVLGRWEVFLTPNLLVVTQGSLGRIILTARPDLPSAYEQSFLGANAWGQLPQIVVDSRYGFTLLLLLFPGVRSD